MTKYKKTKIKPRFYIFLALFPILLIGIFFLIRQTLSENMNNQVKIEPNKNYVIFNEDRTFLIYPEKIVIEIPEDLRIAGKTTLKEMVENSDFQGVIIKLNLILPVKIEKYFSDIEIKYDGEIKEFPYIEDGYGKLIDSKGLAQLFFENYYESELVEKKTNVVIDMINCSGDIKYFGKEIANVKNHFGYKVNTSEDSKTAITYVINNGMAKEKFNDLITFLKRKYIVQKPSSEISTIAKAIILLGDDKENEIKIQVSENKGSKSNITNRILEKNGYTRLLKEFASHEEKENTIYYTKNNYFMAYKISKLLRINKLEEKETGFDVKIVIVK